MSKIDELAELMPLPPQPLEVPSWKDWRRYEHELTKLPGDYKEFIRRYGTGVIDDFLWVFNPAADNPYLNLISQAQSILPALEETSRKFPDLFSVPTFPEVSGFLPFASTDNGDNVFWVADGKPDQWTIAVMGPRSPDCFYHGVGIVDFLVSMIRGDTRCRIFPADFPSDPPLKFVATRE